MNRQWKCCCFFGLFVFFLRGQVFDDLRENAPSSLDKLVGVAGDVSQDGLGLSDQDVARLSADVSVVFHSAARITFDTDLAQVCVCVCVLASGATEFGGARRQRK